MKKAEISKRQESTKQLWRDSGRGWGGALAARFEQGKRHRHCSVVNIQIGWKHPYTLVIFLGTNKCLFLRPPWHKISNLVSPGPARSKQINGQCSWIVPCNCHSFHEKLRTRCMVQSSAQWECFHLGIHWLDYRNSILIFFLLFLPPFSYSTHDNLEWSF